MVSSCMNLKLGLCFKSETLASLCYMENRWGGAVGREIRSTKGRKITCCDVLEMEKHQNLENEEERKLFQKKLFNILWLIRNGVEKKLEQNNRQISQFLDWVFYCCCQVASVVSDSVRPHRQQPTRLRRPWDSPGKNTGVGCHFLLQCMKVKSENEVAQSCRTLRDSMDCRVPGSSVHGIFQARVLEWVAIAFSMSGCRAVLLES